MSEFHTSYQKFESAQEDDVSIKEDAYLMHAPDHNKALWHHIEDLDSFFVRVYQYHQNHGFLYILSQRCLQFLEFVFIVGLLTFLSSCVNYDVLFANNVSSNGTEKVGFEDVIYSNAVCFTRVGNNPFLVMLLIVASAMCVFYAGRIFYHFVQLQEIKKFYGLGLHIKKEELNEMTWQEVQKRLMTVQKEQQMCIHKQELTELDIYNRILRFKNYMVAMVNKGLLPPRFRLPFLGDTVFFTEGLKYNLELLFFWGPDSIFANRFHLRDEYKTKSRREELAERLSKNILRLGLINLVLSPFIFFYQVWYTFLSYTDLMKREPGAFSARTWSLYARLYFRHFNELPHEFQGRLNRGYKPAKAYMETFTSPLIALYSKSIAFVAGSFLAVLVVLTIWDFDVLEVEHLFAVGAVLSFIVHVCRSVIPDENAVSCPDQLMRRIVAQVHYAPDSWHGCAHTYFVRDQFAQLFQYKAANIIEELLSPIVTPFILIFWLRKRSLKIVDFFRHFTIDIAGVGDVCSFAQLDIKKHGDPKWHDTSKDEPDYYQKADDGKVELSLMHFAVSNPEWNVPRNEDKFLSNVKHHAQINTPALNEAYFPPNLNSSSLGPESLMTSLSPYQATNHIPASYVSTHPTLSAYPRSSLNTGANPNIASMQSLQSLNGAEEARMLLPDDFHAAPPLSSSRYESIDQRRELTSMEMSVSALYMHQLHHQRLHHHYNGMMWETIPDNAGSDDGTLAGSSCAPSSSTQETVKLFVPSSPTTKQGYNSMAPLSGENLFGPYSKTGQSVGKSHTTDPKLKPFLAISHNEAMIGGDGFRVNEDVGHSSDSDAAPQEFHVDERPYHDASFSMNKNTGQSVDFTDRPSKM